jgi:hypothetical protein
MMIESKTMQEIHAIRLELGEITKEMTPEELVVFYNDSTKDAIAKYGIVVGTPREQKKRAI